jgi:hypothetical protein
MKKTLALAIILASLLCHASVVLGDAAVGGAATSKVRSSASSAMPQDTATPSLRDAPNDTGKVHDPIDPDRMLLKCKRCDCC